MLFPWRRSSRTFLWLKRVMRRPPPSVLGWNDSTRFVVEAIQKAVVKGGDPKTLLAEAAKAMNERIEK